MVGVAIPLAGRPQPPMGRMPLWHTQLVAAAGGDFSGKLTSGKGGDIYYTSGSFDPRGLDGLDIYEDVPMTREAGVDRSGTSSACPSPTIWPPFRTGNQAMRRPE